MTRLREKRNVAGNGHSLQIYVSVTISHNPNGWADRWASAFTKVLDDYPGLGTICRRLRPTFLFTIHTAQQLLVDPVQNMVVIPVNIDPNGPVTGADTLARFFVVDMLAHLLVANVDTQEKQAYQHWIDQEDYLGDAATLEEDVAYVFYLAAIESDDEIEMLRQAYPTTFAQRWQWVRDRLVIPNL